VIFVVLGGPAPGATGTSCGDDFESPDFVEYCYARKAYECDRARARMEFDDTVWRRCRGDVASMCDGGSWASDCFPTRASTSACLSALIDLGRLSTPTSALPECQYDAVCNTAF
jgi:hypothetical protein